MNGTTQVRCSMAHVIDSARWFQGCERVEFIGATPSSITVRREILNGRGAVVRVEVVTLAVSS